MYIPDCTTGSSVRKAISHIFGRNKMCTRLIPENVWVHYCRKHYQRARYRNPREYAQLQCDLVQLQIRRIHDWSCENIRTGSGGIVQDWTLAVRRREQNRIDNSAGKRKRSVDDHDDSREELDNQGDPVPNTAVPQWLVPLAKTGYDTAGILELFNKLHQDILEKKTPAFPDIEILPNIATDRDDPKAPKGYKRCYNGHQRAQSLGTGATSSSTVIKPGVYRAGFNSPPRKKRQPSTNSKALPARTLPPIQGQEYSMEPRRGLSQQTTRRSMFNIDEHHADGDEYSMLSKSPYTAPLPAPIPQRMSSQSMATHLECNNMHGPPVRRPIHQRSQSDVSAFSQKTSDYSPLNRAESPRGYSSPVASQQPLAPATRCNPRPNTRSMYQPSRHGRHSSASPMVPHTYSSTVRQGNVPQTSSRYATVSPNQSVLPLSPGLHITETQNTRNL